MSVGEHRMPPEKPTPPPGKRSRRRRARVAACVYPCRRPSTSSLKGHCSDNLSSNRSAQRNPYCLSLHRLLPWRQTKSGQFYFRTRYFVGIKSITWVERKKTHHRIAFFPIFLLPSLLVVRRSSEFQCTAKAFIAKRTLLPWLSQGLGFGHSVTLLVVHSGGQDRGEGGGR